MQAVDIVRKILWQSCQAMHKARREAVIRHTQAAMVARSHTLSNLARALQGSPNVRHRVKCVDRLLGNHALQGECLSIYTALSQYLLAGVETPVILVDWSDLKATQGWQMIRASYALQGRSMTLYEEVHASKVATSAKVHWAFLRKLQGMLPANCRPIIVSDAGFRSTWFQAVQELGWDWVGRIRNRDKVREHGQTVTQWQGCKTLYPLAKACAKSIGIFDYAHSNPITCRLVCVKKSPKGRQHTTLKGAKRRSSQSCKHSKAQREPWLLACSVSLNNKTAKAIVGVYAQRMQIEQAFRDTKNARLGLGLSESGTRTGSRLAVLALIAFLAEFVLHLLGHSAQQRNRQAELQLTNRKTRAEMSVFKIGQILAHTGDVYITREDLRRTLKIWRAPNPALQI